ncbi:MAG: DUF4837 family protein [Prevotellaceae bacterium]|jgi:hypothetical protein|nr:DUF4837 family protein [Prevotellaceae bacterium]
MKNLSIIKITVILSAIIFFNSCKDENKILPSSTGKAGEVIVVANANEWNGNIGETIRKILTESDTLLPQPEAKFSIINISHRQFSNILKVHRNVVFIQIEKDKTECEISSKTDAYSSPQTILYVIGADENQIVEALQKRANKIIDVFEQAELERIKSGLRKVENSELRKLVENKYGYSMYFPQDYDLFGDKNEFMWLGLRTTKGTEGVFIYTYPYKNKSQLTMDSLIAKRNDILQQYVLLDKEPQGSAYMTTTTYIEPSYNTLTINEDFFARIRGLWEVKNDFMGGPFVSYTTIDKEKNMVITFDGFVYAPSRTKRDLLRHIEGIILTVKKVVGI